MAHLRQRAGRFGAPREAVSYLTNGLIQAEETGTWREHQIGQTGIHIEIPSELALENEKNKNKIRLV